MREGIDWDKTQSGGSWWQSHGCEREVLQGLFRGCGLSHLSAVLATVTQDSAESTEKNLRFGKSKVDVWIGGGGRIRAGW